MNHWGKNNNLEIKIHIDKLGTCLLGAGGGFKGVTFFGEIFFAEPPVVDPPDGGGGNIEYN